MTDSDFSMFHTFYLIKVQLLIIDGIFSPETT